jgi:hypothetical protein
VLSSIYWRNSVIKYLLSWHRMWILAVVLCVCTRKIIRNYGCFEGTHYHRLLYLFLSNECMTWSLVFRACHRLGEYGGRTEWVGDMSTSPHWLPLPELYAFGFCIFNPEDTVSDVSRNVATPYAQWMCQDTKIRCCVVYRTRKSNEKGAAERKSPKRIARRATVLIGFETSVC